MQLKPNAGFTLLEIAIVMTIVGLMFIPLFSAYEIYLRDQKNTVTRENIAKLSEQMSYFYTSSSPRRLPCPAAPGLARTDAMYGKEADENCDPTAMGLALNTCSATGLCLVSGTRDADGNGVNDPVVIGAFPFNSVREMTTTDNPDPTSNNIAFDGWGRQFTYAVTLSLAQPNQYKYYFGAIDARDEFNITTAGLTQDGQYALISHGQDGNGAYTPDGVLYKPCGTVSVDAGNCDLNAVFFQGLGRYEGNATSFFDDIVYFGKSQNSNLWTSIISGGTPTNDIYNLNATNIGIGTDAPTQKLDVAGTIRADNNIRTNILCDKTGTDCFNTELVSGTGIVCPAGRVMVSVRSSSGTVGTPECVVPSFVTPLPSQSCPGYVTGIRSDGTIICLP